MGVVVAVRGLRTRAVWELDLRGVVSVVIGAVDHVLRIYYANLEVGFRGSAAVCRHLSGVAKETYMCFSKSKSFYASAKCDVPHQDVGRGPRALRKFQTLEPHALAHILSRPSTLNPTT